jgi:prepilin-type N-terminal cleavage/methylation domain-containing protein
LTGVELVGGAGASRAERGFTLIEVLATIAIMVTLMGLMIVGLGKYRQRAYLEGSRGVLESTRSALESYKTTYSRYPPDGFDYPVFWGAGGTQQQIKGAQCLVYFLGLPTIRISEVGDDIRTEELNPFLDLTRDMLSGGGDFEERLANPQVELVDAFGNPIHYDNLERGKDGSSQVNDQSDAAIHTSPDFFAADQHGPDPRSDGGQVVAQNTVGTFDLWSHGVDMDDVTDDVTNWD